MVSLAAFTQTIRNQLLPSKRGWIGIDFGSQVIKLAQVERVNGSYQITAKWLLGYPNEESLRRAEVREPAWSNIVAPIRSLSRMFCGRECAVTLPVSVMDTRCFEIPRGNALETRNIVREELAADLGQEPSDLACDYWETANDNRDDTMMRVQAVSLPKDFALSFATELLKARLECQAMDGVPCALARAVAMITPVDDETSVAVDLGYASSSLVVVQSGQPVFFRSLRDVGLQTLTAPLRNGLQLSAEECRQLLQRFGIPASGQPATAAAQVALQHMAPGLETLADEVQRTLAYVGQQYRGLSPKRIWLFGGGATIRNLPQFLEEKVHLPVTPWRLSPTDDGAHLQESLFGVAAALSLLAWEKR